MACVLQPTGHLHSVTHLRLSGISSKDGVIGSNPFDQFELFFLCLCRATMTDRKAVIKNADMSEDMQQDAVDCATQAMEKYNIEKDIAAYIKKVGWLPLSITTLFLFRNVPMKGSPCLHQWCCFLFRSLTKSTTPRGIVSLGETLGATWRMKPSISSTSTWARLPFFSSSPAENADLPSTRYF